MSEKYYKQAVKNEKVNQNLREKIKNHILRKSVIIQFNMEAIY